MFEGLGKMPGKCKIKLDKNSIPTVQALALYKKLKLTLNTIIEKVKCPTAWVNSILLVERWVKNMLKIYASKEKHEAIYRKLGSKSIFTFIDMKYRFWQVEIDKSCSKLCTFNTPFGRYKD